MNDLRKYITILENASEDELQKYRDELQKYRDELEYWQNEYKKYWPVSPELMAQYKDGTHTRKDGRSLHWTNQNSKWHRDGDLPAYIGRDGSLEWYQNGLCHRDGDKPAYIGRDGSLGWWQNGKWHRDGDKPAIIRSDGALYWVQNDQRHRDNDKPAYIGRDGVLAWYQNGERHRFRGPALIRPYGTPEWWWRGEYIPVKSQEEFIEYLKKHKGLQRFRVNKP